jgi:hypothetical protein
MKKHSIDFALPARKRGEKSIAKWAIWNTFSILLLLELAFAMLEAPRLVRLELLRQLQEFAKLTSDDCEAPF